MDVRAPIVVTLEKPNSFSIPKDPVHKKDFMSQIIKKASQVPSPAQYNYNNGLGKNGKFFISNSKAPSYFT